MVIPPGAAVAAPVFFLRAGVQAGAAVGVPFASCRQRGKYAHRGRDSQLAPLSDESKNFF